MEVSNSNRKILTALTIKFLEIKKVRYEVPDIPGLFLRVNPNGSKVWKINKSINGRRIVKTIGNYPEVSIFDARNTLKELVSKCKLTVNDNTFEEIFQDWYELKKKNLRPASLINIKRVFVKYLLKPLGSQLWDTITPAQLIKTINLYVPDKSPTIKKLACSYIKHLEKYAVNTGRTEQFRFQAIGEAFPKHTKIHLYSIHPKYLVEFFTQLRDILDSPRHTSFCKWNYRDLFKMAFYSLLRPGEYLRLKWSYVDFENKLINLPAEIMKKNRPHSVPITRQLEELLNSMEHKGEYMFPIIKSAKPSEKKGALNCLQVMLLRIYVNQSQRIVPHGIRSIGRTWMAENNIPFEVAENCLSHKVGNDVVNSYNRTTLLEKRRVVMQQWDDYVEECIIKAGF